MKQVILALAAAALFFSCSTTTKVLFDAKAHPEIQKIGIVELDKEPKIGKLFPNLESHYRVSSVNYAKRFIAREPVYLNEKISGRNPDVVKIRELCEKNGLDGLIITYVQFRQVVNNLIFIKTSKYFESVVYTKLYDKEGKMLYNVVHDAREDYYKTRTTDEEVSFSLGITFQKINKIREKT